MKKILINDLTLLPAGGVFFARAKEDIHNSEPPKRGTCKLVDFGNLDSVSQLTHGLRIACAHLEKTQPERKEIAR